MSNGKLKRAKSWPLRTTNLVVFHCRYLSENVIHSLGMTPYARVIIANTPTAPARHCAQVAGRSDFGFRRSTKVITSPTSRNSDAQMSRPAGRRKCQSGIRLGIGPVVLQ